MFFTWHVGHSIGAISAAVAISLSGASPVGLIASSATALRAACMPAEVSPSSKDFALWAVLCANHTPALVREKARDVLFDGAISAAQKEKATLDLLEELNLILLDNKQLFKIQTLGILDTHPASEYPEVQAQGAHLRFEEALAPLESFVRVGYPNALRMDESRRAEQGKFRAKVRESDRAFITALAETDPSPLVKIAARRTVDSKNADAVVEFFRARWQEASRMELDDTRARSLRVFSTTEVRLAQGIAESRRAEEKIPSVTGSQRDEASKLAARQWRSVQTQAVSAQGLALKDRSLAAACEKSWTAVLGMSNTDNPNWDGVPESASRAVLDWNEQARSSDERVARWHEIAITAEQAATRLERGASA